MKKLLLCRPHGGLNDILCQIDKCIKYASKHDRELYIDGSRSGFLDSFENYFVPSKGVHLKNIDFLSPPFDVYPHCLSDNITTFKLKWDNTVGTHIHIPTNTVPSFDFDKSYAEQLLVHEQCGGGTNSIKVFEKFTLKENIRLHISKIIENLGEYDAIHVRHTDYKTDYQKFFVDINDKLGDKIVLCTDSYECQVYAKSLWKERLQIVTNVPDTQGIPLHHNRSLDRFQTNIDTLTDLFVLACSKNLYTTNVVEKGAISGFGSLAHSLCGRKDLIEKLLWNKKTAVDTPNTSYVPSSKNNPTADMMYNLVDNLCKKELLVDIAPLGKAKQSSLSKWSKPNDAQRAVQKGEWDFAFHTEKEQNPWWELTLDRPNSVEYIVLHNRKSMCQERSRKLSVEVFESEKYHQVYQGDLLFGSEPNGLPLILPVKYSKKIEKIKITLQANEYLHLSCVNVLSPPFQKSSKKINTDYVISLGNACRPAHHLSKNNLRVASNPLDWMMGYSLDTVIHLFETGFSDFFYNIEEDVSKAKHHRWITDISNNIIDMHLFPKDVTLEEAVRLHHTTMKTRYERMHNNILQSDHILFVSNRNEPLDNFKKFLFSMYDIYHKKITYLNIRNSEKESEVSIDFTEELKFIEYSFVDVHKGDENPAENDFYWMGNVQKWTEVMQTITLSGKIPAAKDLKDFH